jgi:predicted nucleic acid-binding protein
LIAVIDSSVVLKWYVEEADSGLARPLIGLRLVAPDLIVAELANALWKKVCRKEATEALAKEALAHVRQAVTLVPSPDLISEAFILSAELLHPVYDCVFLALAKEFDLPLITADGKFCRRVRAASGHDVVLLEEWKTND